MFIVALLTIARTWSNLNIHRQMNEWWRCIYIYIYIYIYTHTHTHTHTICIYTHTHSGILLSHEKEQNGIICSSVDWLRVCHTKWSKSEREKQMLYISTYMWNLEKWYRLTYLQGRNRDTEVENGHVDTEGEEEGKQIGRLVLTCIHYHV